ncbi:MAG: hypothetical protein M0Q13_07755 [Methanothrix sp.]|nr:hypothetical protein [Methanothrix sp.]
MDLCDGMNCQHTPQSCEGANSSAGALFGKVADISTAGRTGSSIQSQQEPSVLKEAVNIPASCDDNNPCTKDSYGANGCVHDPVNCDDGNASTTDLCGSSGCVHTPVLGESSRCGSVEFLSPVLPEKEAANISTSCDDNSPCTIDSYGANGCVHDYVNCDDGNASTTDVCGSSGCVHTPLIGESYSVEFLSPVLPATQNKTADENTTINESQSAIEELKAQPICDDGNPCTTDAYNDTGCVYALMNCDDGNDSTIDSCKDGACTYVPMDSNSIIRENNSNAPSSNNSTVLSSNETIKAGHPSGCDDHDPCTVDTLNGTRCEHKPKVCDDGNPSTNDYCFGGVCYNTTLNCDDGKNCTIDSFNGKVCVNTLKNCDDKNACTIDTCVNGKCVHTSKNCNDGNPCTIDYCDRARGCMHSYVVCGQGNAWYPYYLYYKPYVAPASTLTSAQSYTIPAGTAITLPWSKSVTSLNTLKVENGIAYPGASPLKFVRSLGLEDQAISGYQTGLSISERAEMIGLSWKDTSFTLTLIQPDGSTLPVQGDNRNVVHLLGSNYDYYFLRNAAKGNWGIEVKPINPGANGVGFSLITGLVKGATPINQP